jgi:hypothetical protein
MGSATEKHNFRNSSGKCASPWHTCNCNNYKCAMEKHFFRMNSGKNASPKHYPFSIENLCSDSDGQRLCAGWSFGREQCYDGAKLNIYKNAIDRQNFRMISGSFAPSKFYPSGKSIDFFHKMQVKVEG